MKKTCVIENENIGVVEELIAELNKYYDQKNFKVADYLFERILTKCGFTEIEKKADDYFNATFETTTFYNISIFVDVEQYADSLDLTFHYNDCKKETELSKAVKCVTSELKKDDDLYFSYQSNIALSFTDTLYNYSRLNNLETKGLNSADFHVIANQAARKFLDMWIDDGVK